MAEGKAEVKLLWGSCGRFSLVNHIEETSGALSSLPWMFQVIRRNTLRSHLLW